MQTSLAVDTPCRRPVPRPTRTARTTSAPRLGIHQYGRLAAAALIAATLCVSVASLATGHEAPSPRAWATVSVAAYETLWDLARTHDVEGLSTAATIQLIRAENNLLSSTLHEGQTVRVPAAAQPEATIAQR